MEPTLDELKQAKERRIARCLAREPELEGRLHRTEDDARAQVTRAKLGAHVAATDEYLRALRADLYTWINEINAELDRRSERDEHAALVIAEERAFENGQA